MPLELRFLTPLDLILPEMISDVTGFLMTSHIDGSCVGLVSDMKPRICYWPVALLIGPRDKKNFYRLDGHGETMGWVCKDLIVSPFPFGQWWIFG